MNMICLRRMALTAVISAMGMAAAAQSPRDSYEAFRNKARSSYNDFRRKANAEYTDFMRRAWREFGEGKTMPKPVEEPVPPVVIEDDKPVVIEDKPVVIEEIIDIPRPEPQPRPLAPIEEAPADDSGYVSATLYGTDFKARFPKSGMPRLRGKKPEDIADGWKQLSGQRFDNAVRDCLANRDSHHLSDWAYLQMLGALADAYAGKGTDEAALLKAYLYCQSGYKMRLAVMDGRLEMLYATPYNLYDKLYWSIDGMKYYTDSTGIANVYICDVAYPGEKAMAPVVVYEQLLGEEPTEERILTSGHELSVKSAVDKGLLEFCEAFPSSQYGADPMTRWAVYANTPTSRRMRETLYPQLREAVAGLDSYTALNKLCNWVQTAFVYEYDDKVWGHDRAFFADETLYYPYCDCEDRSILLTRLARDILGLRCALVYYPGHLATAIALGDEAKGDYITIGKDKFIVCDPTFIGASIGRTMPGMDNAAARVVVLE